MDFVFAVLYILKRLAFAQQNSYSALQMLYVFSMGIKQGLLKPFHWESLGVCCISNVFQQKDLEDLEAGWIQKISFVEYNN